MASNRERGVWFEVIAETALQQAIQIAGIPGMTRWNEKPDAMSIMPDFTVGITKDQPSHFLLVTAISSARNAELKSWRNLDELYQIKAQVPGSPIAVSLYFQSVIKQGLGKVGLRMFDSTLLVQEKTYYGVLDKWVTANFRKTARDKDSKRSLLSQSRRTDNSLEKAISDLAQDIAHALQQRKTDLDPLWSLMRTDYNKSHTFPSSKNTSARRGLGKLLILEPELRKEVYVAYEKNRLGQTGSVSSRIAIINDALPAYPFNLGLFRRMLGGAQVIDQDILGVLNLLGTTTCEVVLQRAPSAMGIWINTLRDLERVNTHVEFVQSHFGDITTPDSLEDLLFRCFHNPSSLSGIAGDEKVWIYEIMVSLLKAKSGKLQGYGLAQLAEDTGFPEFSEGGFLIPPFIQRTRMLEPDRLRGLSNGLAKRFSQNIKQSDLDALKNKVVDWVIKENLEDRLIPYPYFEPLLWLLEAELKNQGKNYSPKVPCQNLLHEYAGISKRSATTPFVRVANTLVHWKSAPLNPNDKTKELCARARSIKYRFSSSTKTFSHRTGVSQLALIIDGTWTNAHLQTLSYSGWDIIVYPDQISQLVSQL